MNITEMRTELGLLLDVTPGTELSTAQMDRAITRAVAELSRFVPLPNVLDLQLDQVITDEAFTSVHDTFVALSNKAITAGSVTVTTTAGTTTYVEDTDYIMDYIGGRIKVLSTGDMANATAFDIDYHRDEFVVDITSDLTRPVQILHVESVRDLVPLRSYDFEWHGDWLIVRAKGLRDQGMLPNRHHLRIWYYSTHTPPAAGAAGSYSEHLDEVVLVGAEGYCLYILAQQEEQQAVVHLASGATALAAGDDDNTATTTAIDAANTALDSITGILAAIRGAAGEPLNDAITALDKVDTELNDISESANVDLASAVTELTLANAALDKVTTEMLSSTRNADLYLDTGDGLINNQNLGDAAPTGFRQYAEAKIAIARAFVEEAIGRVQHGNALLTSAAHRVAFGQTYIAEAQARIAHAQVLLGEALRAIEQANGYLTEAQTRLARWDRHNQQASGYQTNSQGRREAANLFRVEAEARIQLFFSILRDRAQTLTQRSIASVIQWNRPTS